MATSKKKKSRDAVYVDLPESPLNDRALSAHLQSLAPPSEAEAESPGMMRSLGDSGLALGSGLVTGVKLVSDAFGADNAVSRTLGGVNEGMQGLLSPYRQAELRRRAELIRAAEESGSTMQEVGAYLGGLAEAPLDTLLNVAGTAAPTVGAMLIPGAREATVARLAGASVGAVQGAGAGKSAIYDAVLQQKLQEGLSEPEARAAADAAQAYAGPNADNIAGQAALGAVAGGSGLESAARALRVGKAAGNTPGLMRRTLAGGAAEGLPEAGQGGYEQLGANVALQREGYDVPTMRGVAGSAALEGLAGGALGAGLAIPTPPLPPAAPAPIVPESGPLTRAANAGAQAGAIPTPGNGIDFVPPTAPPPPPPADMTTALGAAPPKDADGLDFEPTFDTGNLALGDVNEIARSNVASQPAFPLERAKAMQALAQERGTPLELVAHPQGGFTLVPRQWISKAVLEEGQQRAQAVEAAANAPVDRAPRRRSDAVDLDPVELAIGAIEKEGTPAAKAFVQDYRAGRVTADEVMARGRERDPMEALAKIQPTPELGGGLILNPQGQPFKNQGAARAARNRQDNPGAFTVQPVQGGFVVAPTQEQADAPSASNAGDSGNGRAGAAEPAAADAGRGVGLEPGRADTTEPAAGGVVDAAGPGRGDEALNGATKRGTDGQEKTNQAPQGSGEAAGADRTGGGNDAALTDAEATWTRTPTAERLAIAQRAGWKANADGTPSMGTRKIANTGWGQMTDSQRARLAQAITSRFAPDAQTTPEGSPAPAPQTPAVEAPAPAGSDAVRASGEPVEAGAGRGEVEADGLSPQEKWLKAILDANRLIGPTGPQLSVTQDGKLTYLGNPNTSKAGKSLMANVAEARKAGATDADIAAALREKQPAQANQQDRLRDARALGKKAGEAGQPRTPPMAFTSLEKQVWRAGWDEAQATKGATPQVPKARSQDMDDLPPAQTDAAGRAERRAKLEGDARWEYPFALKGAPQEDVDAQRSVVDFMNGDITRTELMGRLASLPEGKIYSFTQRLENDAPTIGEVNKMLEARRAPAKREAFEHAGLKVYPTRFKRGDQVIDGWAVQSPENKGTDKVLGDTLHETVEEAKKAAELEARQAADRQATRERIDAQEKAEADAREAKKEANKGKSLLERRADAVLDKEVRDGETGEVTTRRAWVAKKVAEGLKPSVEQEDKIKPMTRAQFNRASNEEQRAHERKVKEAGKKDTYWLGDYSVTKIEYDYAKSLDAGVASTQEPAKPAKDAKPARSPMERYIKVAADSIEQLRKPDVFRVLVESNPPELRADIAAFIKESRPDLAAEVDAVLAEAAESPGIHKDPAEPAEPVTPEVVGEAIKTGVKATDRKPSEMRAELLAEIDQAIQEAPDYPDFQEAVKQFGEKEAISLYTKDGGQGDKGAPAGYSRPHRLFSVEGDGKFKIQNSVRQLQLFKKQVQNSPGFKDSKTPAPVSDRTKNDEAFGVERGSSGTEAAIRNMLDEGDYQAAKDYADFKGLTQAEWLAIGKKLPKADRAGFDAWNAGQQARASEPAAEPAAQADATPQWHTPLPTEGSQVTNQDRTTPSNPKSVIDGRKVVSRLAQEAMDAITRNQNENIATGGIKMTPWVLPATNDRNGVVRLLPEDQTPGAPWQQMGTEPIAMGGTRERALGQLMERLRSAPIIASDDAAAEPAAKIEDIGEKIGGARKDTAERGMSRGTKAEKDDRPAWARRFEISQIVTPGGMLGEVKDAGRWVIRDNKSLDWTKQPKQVGRQTFATKEEAEAFVPIAAVGLKHRAVPTRDGKYEIWRDINDRKRVKVVDRVFDTRDEAMAYMLANAVPIVETNTTFGEADIPLPPDRVRRGEVRRKGNVVGDDFKEAFGLRGVEFGNWNNQDERQALMNDAWDGLMDLADVLGLPPKALGMNGELALAFGARGHGLQGARAHYELERVVINLTKEKGAGSLAHEWFHALDHYFGRQDGKASAQWEVGKDGTRSLKVSDPESAFVSSGFSRQSKVREELRAAYNKLLETMFKKAEVYVQDTEQADKFVGRAKADLQEALDRLRASLAEQKDPKYWKRNNKPASAEQLAEFDAIAKQMLEGEATALETEWRTIFKGGDEKKLASARASVANRWTNDSLERLSALHKAVRGNAGFSAEGKGVLDYLRANMNRYSQRLKMLADAQSGDTKTRAVPTEFAMNAKELDQGRGSDYWTTPHEMAARAFQGYVEDRIAQRGDVSRFLNYGPENVGILTPWGFKRPFPAGQERKAINAAFDQFIGQIQTRTDDAGNVAMFSRQGQPTRGVSLKDAQAAVAVIRQALPKAPDIIVVDRFEDAPQDLQDAIMEAGARNDWEAVFHTDGKIYVFPTHIADLDRFMFVVGRHEIRHAGFAAMLGDEKDAILLSIGRANRRLALEANAKMTQGLAPSFVVGVEEALADMPVEEIASLTRIKTLVAGIRRWLRATANKLRKAGWNALANAIEPRTWSDNDVIAFVAKAEAMSRGGAGSEARFKRGAAQVTTNDEGHPEFAYAGTKLAFPVEAERIEVIPVEGQRVMSYAIMPTEGFDVLGHVELLLENGQPVSLLDIVAYDRGNGVGRKAVETLLRAFPNAELNISNIVPEAQGFWERMGIPRQNLEEGAAYDGTLTLETYLQAQDGEGPRGGPGRPGEEGRGADAGAKGRAPGAVQGRGEVRFSRSGSLSALREAGARRADAVREANLFAGYKVGDFLQSHGKLSWWDKTLGTPFNLARKFPGTFGKVYDAVQGFLSDVSFYATEAANLAPTILPKLETLADIKKQALSPEDTKAIAAPIFEGTLLWTRDAKGKPITMEEAEAQAAKLSTQEKERELLKAGLLAPGVLRMWQGLPIDQYERNVESRYASQLLKAGIVWTPDELRSKWKLTLKQAGLYSEFRAAVDKSLDDLTASEIARLVRQQLPGMVREEGQSADDYAMAVRDALFEAGDDATADKVAQMANRLKELKDLGYAPLSRFGHYTLDVVDADGERVYFGLFESQADANKMARQMRAEFPQATVSQGTQSKEDYKLLAGVSPETVELFGEMLGLDATGDKDSDQAFQEYLKRAKSTRSALKRLIHRKGIAGFSEDAGRVLAGFITSNARRTASNHHLKDILEAVEDIPKGQGELKDYASKLAEYVNNPVEEAQALRGLMFAQYLGGSVASALVNMTQPIAVTLPFLSQHTTAAKAAKAVTGALADMASRKKLEAGLESALKMAEEKGIVAPQEIHYLAAQARGQGALRSGDGTTGGNAMAAAQNGMSRLSLAWGKLFGFAELVNRRATFIASYRVAVAQGYPNPFEFASDAVNETQFTYNKGNRPDWARGAIGATLFTFKTYSISYVELMARMWKQGGPEGKKAFALALATMVLMSGLDELPFMEDAEDLVDGFAQKVLGLNWQTKLKRQEFLADALGKDLAMFLSRGVSGLPGVPLDVSGRLGMGNLIPGTGLLRADSTNPGRDVAEIAGPVADLLKRGAAAVGMAAQGDLGKAALEIAPTAVRNVAKAADMAETGMYRDATGKKVVETTAGEALLKGIGFQPNTVAKVQDATGMRQRMIALNKDVESEIADLWAQGRFENDPAKVEKARNRLKDWNRDNPDSPIRIGMGQIQKRVKAMRQTKQERIEKTAPKELRAAVRQDLQPARSRTPAEAAEE